jgi:hypothetical protein
MSDPKHLPPCDDAEAAALDEAWSALGQLLAAGGPRLDQDEVVRSVCARLARSRTIHRRLIAALLTAAALLLAVGAAWWPRLADQQVVAAARKQQVQIQPAVADFAWHDELADEVNQARLALWTIENRVQVAGIQAYWVLQELDDLEREMERSPL